jgi:hypothetical protein
MKGDLTRIKMSENFKSLLKRNDTYSPVVTLITNKFYKYLNEDEEFWITYNSQLNVILFHFRELKHGFSTCMGIYNIIENTLTYSDAYKIREAYDR